MPGYRYRQIRNIRSRGMMARRIQRNFRNFRKRRFRSRYRKSKINKLATMVYANQDLRWKSVATTNLPAPSGLTPAQDFLGLLDIAAGDEHYQRQGNKIALKTFNLKGQLFGATGDAYNKIRILIVQIRSLYNAPTINDVKIEQILEPDVTNPTTVTTTILSHYKKNSQYKYNVLYDRMYQTQNIVAGAVRPNNIMWNISHKFKTPLPVHYQSSSPDIPVQNMVVMFALSDSSIAPNPLLTFNTRVTWTG